MDDPASFWAMGGYAAYVWPAFAVTALVLGGLLLSSLRALRARQAALAALEREMGAMRRRRDPQESGARASRIAEAPATGAVADAGRGRA